jgi:hypothetical protein
MARKVRARTIPRSIIKRGIYSFVVVAIILLVGTLGMHLLEGLSYIDAFYFMSMLATAQGPAVTPVTLGGKVFASIMAFISVGAVVAALGYIFGPFFGTVWRAGVRWIEEEEEVHLRKGKDDAKQ